ncbi:hypothetical protein AB0J80_19465 [Actinoplanes sp. NPDC049548]|uniref:hypothetical protein n=1 Tax=Actinoplanes sp. NPDC049548 TaxID=3155152 RepID=UPI003427E444
MTARTGPARGRLTRMPLVLRAIIAGVAMVIFPWLGIVCGVLALFQYNGGLFAEDPWQLWFSLAAAGVGVCLAAPVILWWFMLPGARPMGFVALVSALVLEGFLTALG